MQAPGTPIPLCPLSPSVDRCPVARSLDDLFLREGRGVRIARGASIYRQEGATDQIYRIAEGTVRIGRYDCGGKRQLGAFHFSGDMFGFEPGSQHRFFAEAVSPCELLAIPHTALSRLSLASGDLLRQLWTHAEAELQRAQEHMLLCRQGAIARVRSFLASTAERLGDPTCLDLPMSRQDIADHLGLTIETVSRTMTQLAETGELSAEGARRIRLAHERRLAA